MSATPSPSLRRSARLLRQELLAVHIGQHSERFRREHETAFKFLEASLKGGDPMLGFKQRFIKAEAATIEAEVAVRKAQHFALQHALALAHLSQKTSGIISVHARSLAGDITLLLPSEWFERFEMPRAQVKAKGRA